MAMMSEDGEGDAIRGVLSKRGAKSRCDACLREKSGGIVACNDYYWKQKEDSPSDFTILFLLRSIGE